MRMSRNGFIIHFLISLKADRPYKATVVYNLATVVYSDIPRQTVVYQLYTTARDFDVAHAKWYILGYNDRMQDNCLHNLNAKYNSLIKTQRVYMIN